MLRSFAVSCLVAFASANVNDTQHFCNGGNPCKITFSPNYATWSYLDLAPLDSTSHFNLTISNGEGQVLVGPSSGQYFPASSGCCGAKSCQSDPQWVKSYTYGYAVQPGGCDQQPAIVSMWNHNSVSSEEWVFTFNSGKGPGPK